MANDNQHRYVKGLFGLLLIAAGLHLPLAQAADQEDDDVDKGWQETVLQLPAAPKSENLLTFYNSGTQIFAIDKQSVSVEKDNSVRYTLVATSSNGAKNVSYEAIRCETYEKKLYAFGRSDGTWSASRRNEWDRISNAGANKQHHILYTEYFCDGNTVAGKPAILTDRLSGRRSPFNR